MDLQHLHDKLLAGTISPLEMKELINAIEDKSLKKELEALMKVQFEDTNQDVQMPDINASKDKFLQIIRKEKRKKLVLLYSSIAASISILVICGILLSPRHYKTNFGELKHFELKDGTVVDLNANSKLVWYPISSLQGSRKVKLEGEAYFDVHHLKDNKPFEIYLSKTKIEVLGTKFNAYNRGNSNKVVLDEGSIRLVPRFSPMKALIVKPGESVIIQEDQIHREEVIHEKTYESEWRNQILYFQNSALSEVLRKLSEIYGFTFRFEDPNLNQRRINFWIPFDNWEETKQSLELILGVSIHQDNSQIFITEN